MDLSISRHECPICERAWFADCIVAGHDIHTHCYQCSGYDNPCRENFRWDDTNDFVLYAENVKLGVYENTTVAQKEPQP